MQVVGDQLEEGEAIRELGPLFRTTEVYLWDDFGVGFTKAPESTTRCDRLEETCANLNNADGTCSIPPLERREIVNTEELELAQEMCALGLPISFSTNKEKKNAANSRCRKGVKGKKLSFHKEPMTSSCSMMNQVNVPSQPPHDSLSSYSSCFSVENTSTESNRNVEEVTGVIVQSNDGLVGQSSTADNGTFEGLTFDTVNSLIPVDEKTETGIASEHTKVSFANYDDFPDIAKLEENRSLDSATSILNFSFDYNSEDTDVNSANSCFRDSLESFQHSRPLNCDSELPSISNNCGDWTPVWDTFYMRYYFYNCITTDSTWYPPPGLEHFSCTTKYEETVHDAVEHESDICITDMELVQENGSSARKQNNSELILSNQELTSRLTEAATANLASDAILFSESGGSDQLESGCFDVNKLGEDFTMVAFHSSDSSLFDGSSEQVQDLLAIEKAGHSPSPDIMDFELDEIDESFHEPENNNPFFDCTEPCEIPSLFNSTDNTLYNGLDLKEIFTTPRGKTSLQSHPVDYDAVINVKHKKRERRIRSCRNKMCEYRDVTLPEEMQGFSSSIVKYWCQRYSLFSKFDSGIKMDEEGWFSVTPEVIARHHASCCGNGTVIDCFAGVGGNTIQFALRNNNVIAIDIDPLKIDFAHHNATIYGVEDRVHFVQGDFLSLAAKLRGDVIFMSPPWGGPDYLKVQTYDIKTMLKPQNGDILFKIARRIAPKVVMFLPRNVDINQLAELSRSAHPPWELKVEKNFLNDKLKAVTAYFTDPSTKTRDIYS